MRALSILLEFPQACALQILSYFMRLTNEEFASILICNVFTLSLQIIDISIVITAKNSFDIYDIFL